MRLRGDSRARRLSCDWVACSLGRDESPGLEHRCLVAVRGPCELKGAGRIVFHEVQRRSGHVF